ncbi:hypothetical protein B1757_08445 [Acidithiobacillus marinus]|uniref:GyrI-like small molecule binding domain-containing protein n=1 Tax=Acidithiobacillus marinus TaxID=187490 RepID=A0A2I1DL41_9PROT|nr:hypothetical protein [Acidithiobacillus marinus]PKY10598.1 hypothetical protein B1757_08445 [Acidithiobacillus marinus]
MAEMRQAPKRDWRRGWAGPLVVFVLLVLGTLWWLGVFQSAAVHEEQGMAHVYIYQNFQGTYRQMVKTRGKLAPQLPASWRDHTEMTLMESEQGSGGDALVKARLGYLVDAGSETPAGWLRGEWPAQDVARVKVTANAAIASWKAYSALADWGKARGIPLHYPLFEMLGPGNRYILLMPLKSLSASS